jgi:hypothetical protein
MLILILGKANMVVFLGRTGNAFTLSSPSSVKSCPNTTDMGLAAFMSSQLPGVTPSICALIVSLWLAVFKLALKVSCISDCDKLGMDCLPVRLNRNLLCQVVVLSWHSHQESDACKCEY